MSELEASVIPLLVFLLQYRDVCVFVASDCNLVIPVLALFAVMSSRLLLTSSTWRWQELHCCMLTQSKSMIMAFEYLH
jgi:hypothetical protein